jgi:hypothetical protein
MIEYIKNIRKKYIERTKIIKIKLEDLPYYKYRNEIEKYLSTNDHFLTSNNVIPSHTIAETVVHTLLIPF